MINYFLDTETHAPIPGTLILFGSGLFDLAGICLGKEKYKRKGR